MIWRVEVTDAQIMEATQMQLTAAEDAVAGVPDIEWYTELGRSVRVFNGSGQPPPALMELAYIGRRP